MMNWWTITKLELQLTIRDRRAVIWSLVAPIAMAWIFGAMFNDKPPGPTEVSIERGDNPAYVQQFFAGLLKEHGLVVTDSEAVARIVIPDSLMNKLTAGDGAQVRIEKHETSDMRVQAISARVREIMYTLTFQAQTSWLTSPPDSLTVASLVRARGPILIDTRMLGQRPTMVTGRMQTLPAMLVMYLLFQLMTFFVVTWVSDIKTGKIGRIMMSPTRIGELFVAQVASRILWALLQVIVVLGGGALMLGVRLDIPWMYFWIMLLAYMVTAISFGMLVGTFFSTIEKANAAGVTIALLFAALGGCWWPLEIVSDGMRAVAMFLPTGLMMDAIGEFMAVGPQAAFPALNFVVLLAMTAILAPIAIKRMHRQIVT